jgi:hypothetical protein
LPSTITRSRSGSSRPAMTRSSARVARDAHDVGGGPVTSAALWWEWHVRLGREEGQALGTDGYYELGHESVAADPAEECACREHRAEGSWGRSAKGRWLPPTPALRNWREQMAAGDVERFEAAAADFRRAGLHARVSPTTASGARARGPTSAGGSSKRPALGGLAYLSPGRRRSEPLPVHRRLRSLRNHVARADG